MKTIQKILLLMSLVLSSCSFSVGYLQHGHKACDCSISAPASWKKTEGMLANAVIQLSDAKVDSHAAVLAESKTQFQDMDLNKYTKIVSEKMLSGLQGKKIKEFSDLTINDLSGKQSQIVFQKNNVDLILIYTILEGKNRFFQILTWTPKDRFESNQQSMEDLIKTFKNQL